MSFIQTIGWWLYFIGYNRVNKKIGFQMNTSTKLTIRWILAMQTLNVIVNFASLIYRYNINNSFAAFRFEQI